MPKQEEINVDNLLDEPSQNILKLVYDFENILIQVTEKDEPSILSRYLIDLAKTENKELQDARIYLTYIVGKVLKTGAKLLGIEMPNKM